MDNELRDALREKLAALEHEQWVFWAQGILDSEPISSDRQRRWQSLFVPYSSLTEEVKVDDRQWADKVLEIVEAEYPSFDVLYTETRDRLIRQLQSIDGLNTKASIIAGFDGVILTAVLTAAGFARAFPMYGIDLVATLLLVGVLFALLSFSLCLLVYKLTTYSEILTPREAYNEYIQWHEMATKKQLLDNMIGGYDKNKKILDKKSSLLNGALLALFIAVFLFSTAFVISALA